MARAFLGPDQPATLRWLAVKWCVQVGLFELTSDVEALADDESNIGWASEAYLGEQVRRALPLLRARQTDPSFGDDVD